MNIVHVVPFIGEEASGPAYTVPELCFALLNHQCSVTLMTLEGSNDLTGKNLEHFLCKRSGYFSRLGVSSEMKMLLLDVGNTTNVYHNHSLWMMPNVYTCVSARKSNKPLVVSPRGTLSLWAFQSGSVVKKIFWPMIQRPALSWTSCFHATAMPELEDIRHHGFKQPVAVIPNGIHIPEVIPRKFHSIRTLLFLGRIHPKKGLDMLLPAWKTVQCKFPNWQLRIVGVDSQGYLDKMKEFADDLSLERVDFAGPLYGGDKWQAYRDASLFILPTYSENFGMSVAESLASGTPAIVTNGAPWQGLLENNCGWWTEIGVDPLIAALEEALDLSDQRLSEMGERGREWMRRDFS
ncbi:MAG: glycosyltransferase [Bacteroidia bacterium]|nr:glycosyltransferase [Bacteroidia bacterium]